MRYFPTLTNKPTTLPSVAKVTNFVKLFFTNANNAAPSLTFTLVFRSALFCLLFSFCANKVGFTKADLQGRGSISASLRPARLKVCCVQCIVGVTVAVMFPGCRGGGYLLSENRKVDTKRERERQTNGKNIYYLFHNEEHCYCKGKTTYLVTISHIILSQVTAL